MPLDVRYAARHRRANGGPCLPARAHSRPLAPVGVRVPCGAGIFYEFIKDLDSNYMRPYHEALTR